MPHECVRIVVVVLGCEHEVNSLRHREANRWLLNNRHIRKARSGCKFTVYLRVRMGDLGVFIRPNHEHMTCWTNRLLKSLAEISLSRNEIDYFIAALYAREGEDSQWFATRIHLAHIASFRIRNRCGKAAVRPRGGLPGETDSEGWQN